jgi:hypothetical protein
MSVKNSSDTIGNRTRDVPVCSAVQVEWGAYTNTNRRREPVHPFQPLYEHPAQRVSLPPPTVLFPPTPTYTLYLSACLFFLDHWTQKIRHYDPSQCQEIPNDTPSHPRRLESSILVWETKILQKLPLILSIKIQSKWTKFILVVIRKPLHKLTFLLHATDWNIKESTNQHCHTNSTKVNTSSKLFNVEISDIPTKRNPHQGDYYLICWLSSITNYMN